MNIFIKNDFTNNKAINWHFVHKKIFKLQNRVVQQLKKKNFRKVRNIQRLILKSFIPRLLISQKFIKIKDATKFNIYKTNCNKLFLNLLNLNNFIQFENYFSFKHDLQNSPTSTYFQFLSLLWVLALTPINETFADSFFYNYRLYRNQVDVLNELCLMFNFTNFKWLLIIRPSNFFKEKNQKWLYKNVLMEKKFLSSVLKSKKFAKNSLKYYNHKEVIGTKKISLTKIIKSSCFYNFSIFNKKISPEMPSLKMKENEPFTGPVIYYNDLILIPSTNLNNLKIIYKLIFRFLNMRGLAIKKNRIWVINVFDGFNFLGWFLKKERGKVLIQISYENIKSHQFEIKKFLKSARFLPMDKVIIHLNQKIINWQSYYAYTSNLYRTWSEMNYYLFWRVWRWCKKRHKNKGAKWLYNRYWNYSENEKWVFHANKQYLKSYHLKKQKIISLPASINVCETKNWKKTQEKIFKKYSKFKGIKY